VSGQLSVTELESIIRLFSAIEPEKFILRENECLSSPLSAMRTDLPKPCSCRLHFSSISQCKTDPTPRSWWNLPSTSWIVQEGALREGFVQRAFETLNEHRASIQCIRVISKILDEVPSHWYAYNRTRSEVATELID
jgi:hypothetical protein